MRTGMPGLFVGSRRAHIQTLRIGIEKPFDKTEYYNILM